MARQLKGFCQNLFTAASNLEQVHKVIFFVPKSLATVKILINFHRQGFCEMFVFANFSGRKNISTTSIVNTKQEVLERYDAMQQTIRAAGRVSKKKDNFVVLGFVCFLLKLLKTAKLKLNLN